MILKNCSIDNFFGKVSGKKLVCYGIGAVFYNFINNYKDAFENVNIKYLVDSNLSKIGEEVCIGKQICKIMSLDSLLKEDISDLVIIITCGFFADVVKQLNLVSEFAQTECYIYDFMLTQMKSGGFCIKQRENCLIPPVIHYCWFGKKELPDLYKRCIESWYKYCPGYEIIEWNEHNCDITENLFAKQAYEKKKYGFVPDYFRLKIIYEHGGIYLDTDVELIRNVDDLRCNEAFCGMERPGQVAFGLGFGAIPGHFVIGKMLERYQVMQFLNTDGVMDQTASPIWQTMDLMNLGMQYGNRLQVVSGMTIYPVEVLAPKNVATRELNKTRYTYSIHHYDASWIFGEDSLSKKNFEEDLKKIRDMCR